MGRRMIIKLNKKKFIALLIICLSIVFPINTFAQSFIDDASQYTVRFRVSVDLPFVEDTDDDEVIRSWLGAGFVVDKSLGLIVTNAHVSGVGNTFIKIAFKGERFIKSELIYVDPELDIALVKVNPDQMPVTSKEGSLSCDKTIKNGTAVAAYGHPKGLKFSASRGIISNQRFLYGKEVIQTDAAINSGNSGGPLINLDSGLIVGINKSTVKKSSGIGLAVPSYLLCKILDLYKAGKSPLPMEVPIKFAKDNETQQYNKISE
jgi:S1-C subfamily serine protease